MDLHRDIEAVEHRLTTYRRDLVRLQDTAEADGHSDLQMRCWLAERPDLLQVFEDLRELAAAREEYEELSRKLEVDIIRLVEQLILKKPFEAPFELVIRVAAYHKLELLFEEPPERLDNRSFVALQQSVPEVIQPFFTDGLKQLLRAKSRADTFACRGTTAWHRVFQEASAKAIEEIARVRSKTEQKLAVCESEHRARLAQIVRRHLELQTSEVDRVQAWIDRLAESECSADGLKTFLDTKRRQLTKARTAEVERSIARTEKTLAELRRQREADERKAEIAEYIRSCEPVHELRRAAPDRCVQWLIHFTRLENLPAIMSDGLLSRKTCKALGISSQTNDEERLDHLPDHISLSISWPNWQLFYRFRTNSDTTSDDWCVLVISADVLWSLDCIFSAENAASGRETRCPPQDRRGIAGFRRLFDDTGGASHGITRKQLAIPDNMPTNPQAEVLVRCCVPLDRIRQIVVYSHAPLVAAQNLLPKNIHGILKVNRDPFGPRSDWKHWRRDIKESQSRLSDPMEF